MSPELLIDNSAWARLGDPALPQRRANQIADALEACEIAACLPFVLEAGYSARTAADHRRLMEELLALPVARIDERIERRALDAQGQLARAGHHRLPPIDLIVAATAERHALGVLHYDADYDVIRARTDMEFDSNWLADRGSL